MRAGGAGALLIALVLAGCGGAGAADDVDTVLCPVMATSDGITSGMDLSPPAWLPAGVPLPQGLSIRRIDEPGKNLTGVVAGGDTAAVVDGFAGGLVDGGYEIVLRPDFVPRSTDAVVALREGWLVRMSVTQQLAEVPTPGGDCTYRDSVQAQLAFTPVTDAEAERARWASSSVTHGAAVAEVSGHRFESQGECVVHDGTWRFTPEPDVTWVDLTVTPEREGQAEVVAGNAMVHDGTQDLMYVLTSDVPPGADPDITLTGTGFSVTADLNDVVGEEGFVPGTITVTCQ